MVQQRIVDGLALLLDLGPRPLQAVVRLGARPTHPSHFSPLRGGPSVPRRRGPDTHLVDADGHVVVHNVADVDELGAQRRLELLHDLLGLVALGLEPALLLQKIVAVLLILHLDANVLLVAVQVAVQLVDLVALYEQGGKRAIEEG